MANVALTINGAPLSGREGMTILEIARENGIDIPTLCYLEDLPPVGACRLCVVRLSKKIAGKQNHSFFTSYTSSDQKNERNTPQDRVFPKLRELYI